MVDRANLKGNSSNVWIPPSGEDLFFNIDGSAKGSPGEAGIGGVLRDSRGKVLGLFSSYVGCLDSNSAELFALHRACSLLASFPSLASRKVIIASDSKVIVSWINGDNFGSFALVDMVYDLRSFLQHNKDVSVIFMHRGSNSFADGLAKRGSSNCGERLEWGSFFS